MYDKFLDKQSMYDIFIVRTGLEPVDKHLPSWLLTTPTLIWGCLVRPDPHSEDFYCSDFSVGVLIPVRLVCLITQLMCVYHSAT